MKNTMKNTTVENTAMENETMHEERTSKMTRIKNVIVDSTVSTLAITGAAYIGMNIIAAVKYNHEFNKRMKAKKAEEATQAENKINDSINMDDKPHRDGWSYEATMIMDKMAIELMVCPEVRLHTYKNEEPCVLFYDEVKHSYRNYAPNNHRYGIRCVTGNKMFYIDINTDCSTLGECLEVHEWNQDSQSYECVFRFSIDKKKTITPFPDKYCSHDNEIPTMDNIDDLEYENNIVNWRCENVMSMIEIVLRLTFPGRKLGI